MKKTKRNAPPVLTGYDPRAVERAPKFADGHLPTDEPLLPQDADARREAPPFSVGADNSVHPQKPPTAPDGISGDWQ